jgi:hypothetical protein
MYLAMDEHSWYLRWPDTVEQHVRPPACPKIGRPRLPGRWRSPGPGGPPGRGSIVSSLLSGHLNRFELS